MRYSRFIALSALTGCANVAPPASLFPSADAAIARMAAGGSCGVALQADAKVDQFGPAGRLRGNLLMVAAVPDRIRMDVVSPFGVTLTTLSSDGQRFALEDLREKRFLTGRASACNIGRLTSVPLAGEVLVDLLRGQPPRIERVDDQARSVTWNRHGYYVVKRDVTSTAEQEVHLAPHPDDYGKPWGAQRIRLLFVRALERGRTVYEADFEGHKSAPTAGPREDPDGIEPPIAPSGPICDAELPRRIHVTIPDKHQDILFRYDAVTWNPPLPEDIFRLKPPAGLPVFEVGCDDAP